MDWKTEQEWMVMRYFKENWPGFPKGKLLKGESPDFRLWTGTRRFIGIELTQVRPVTADQRLQGYLDRRNALRQVRESILAKEEKTRLYRLDHPYQLWLIIFADYSEADSMERTAAGFRESDTVTSFDRIFLFNLDAHQVKQLK
jgi:hypothetical protein